MEWTLQTNSVRSILRTKTDKKVIFDEIQWLHKQFRDKSLSPPRPSIRPIVFPSVSECRNLNVLIIKRNATKTRRICSLFSLQPPASWIKQHCESKRTPSWNQKSFQIEITLTADSVLQQPRRTANGANYFPDPANFLVTSPTFSTNLTGLKTTTAQNCDPLQTSLHLHKLLL
jgi:hypothetical protein